MEYSVMEDHKSTTLTGREAETAARRHLEKQGLTTVATNFRCRLGEIDLIMRDGEELVFVEVRARALGAWVSALESIGPGKQRRLRATASYYLGTRPGRRAAPCRFDVVLVRPENGSYRLQWLQDVIQA